MNNLKKMSAAVVFAQGVENPIGVNTLQDAISNLVNGVLGLTAIVAVAFIVYGGFLYITSQGDQQQIDAGKKAITGAVIGIAVVGLAYVIVKFVITAVGGSS